MLRAFITLTVALACLLSPELRAQVEAFDVASVKPNIAPISFASTPRVRSLPGGRLIAVNMELRGLIEYAYALPDYRFVEGSDPLLFSRFDIEAKTDREAPLTPRGVEGPINRMLQALLAERFKLMVRRGSRDDSVYVLSLARADGRLGPGLRPSTCPPLDVATPPPQTPAATGPDAKRRCGSFWVINGVAQGDGISMPMLARFLSNLLFDRPVLDRTKVDGLFEIDTKFSLADLPRYEGRMSASDPSSPYPSVFSALREDLGLKLESKREPVPVLIVEHVEPLIEN
ncbi:MAG TPA: TIGR03435 family protein [Vicinamibacterales bacterium]